MVKKLALSPSSQRVWIEMSNFFVTSQAYRSPSSQRVWIEIGEPDLILWESDSRPLHRGCGLKSLFEIVDNLTVNSRPLHRGCGLK